MPLALGLFSMTTGPCTYPDAAARVARAAEAAGFDSLWGGEHVVLPVGYATDHPTTEDDSQHQHIAGPIVDLDTELVDQFVAFGAVAAATRSIPNPGISVIRFARISLPPRHAPDLQP